MRRSLLRDTSDNRSYDRSPRETGGEFSGDAFRGLLAACWNGARGASRGPADRDRSQKPALSAIAAGQGASPPQIALAWLLARSPRMLPIPGTSSLAHLEANWEARRIALSPEEMDAIGT
jgi:aryl-alcohol dehydrogenase-like predicted oxidoreductase